MALKQELKEFMLRGNVIDMAVGIIVGGAFSKIVSSFVNDILMPPISIFLGNDKVSAMKIVLKEAVMDGDKVVTPAISWNYGMFIQTISDFIIIGVSIFFVIKGINQLRRKKEAEPAPEPDIEAAIPNDEKLLMEIRDLLEQQNKNG